MILQKLTITDTFKQWRDKINAIIHEYEGVPSTDQTTGIMTIDTDRTQAYEFVVDIPSTFNDSVVFNNKVTVMDTSTNEIGEINAISTSTRKLENAININGISFDGTRDIVTPTWGMERDFYVTDHTGDAKGSLVKIDGSKNYILKMPSTFKGYLEGNAHYADELTNTIVLDGVSFNGTNGVTHYAICNTSSGIQVKEVEIPHFVLEKGATVTVQFIQANTAAEPMLNVSKTGNAPIYLRDKVISPNVITPYTILTLVYDGLNYNVVTGIDNDMAQNLSAENTEYPLLASIIKNKISRATTSVFAEGMTMNPSSRSISLDGNFITKSKFVANINNDTPTTFFTTKNSDESYLSNTNVATYKRYLSYEDGNNHMLTTLEFYRTGSGGYYSNIVVPKFNANGEETAHSVLQIGWEKDQKQMNFAGNTNLSGTLNVTGDATFGSYVQIQPYGWLDGRETDDGSGVVREFVVSADKYETDWNTTGAAIALYSKNSVKNPGQLVLKGGKSDGNWGALHIKPDGSLTHTKRSGSTSTNLFTLSATGDASFAGNVSGAKIYNAVFNDYAEFFEKGEETEAGDIVALDITSNEERYVKATDKSKLVVGIHSDSYGHILGGDVSIEESEKTHIPVGLSGRVFVKFKGKSLLGEAVVPSDTPGVGRLYDEFIDDKKKIVGYIVHDPEPTSKDIRKVRVLINR